MPSGPNFLNPNDPSNGAYLWAMCNVYVDKVLAPEKQATEAANNPQEENGIVNIMKRMAIKAAFNNKVKDSNAFPKGGPDETASLAASQGLSADIAEKVAEKCAAEGTSPADVLSQVEKEMTETCGSGMSKPIKGIIGTLMSAVSTLLDENNDADKKNNKAPRPSMGPGPTR